GRHRVAARDWSSGAVQCNCVLRSIRDMRRACVRLIHAGALVPSKETPPLPLRATVQIILVPLANATRYLPPRLFDSLVSSSKVSDSSVPLEPNVRRPNSRRNGTLHHCVNRPGEIAPLALPFRTRQVTPSRELVTR